MKKENVWCIGDIHGMLDKVNALLKKIPEADNLIFLGDYIDRGPDSKGVVDRILKEKHRSIYLTGNHERSMLKFFDARDDFHLKNFNMIARNFLRNGGGETAQSYGIGSVYDFKREYLPEEHLDFYKNLKVFYEGDNFIAVHAGVDPEKSDLQSQNEEEMLWIRDGWYKHEQNWKGKFIVYGHTVTTYLNGSIKNEDESKYDFTPYRQSNSIGIDTGACFDGYLTAYNPITEEIISV